MLERLFFWQPPGYSSVEVPEELCVMPGRAVSKIPQNCKDPQVNDKAEASGNDLWVFPPQKEVNE